MHIHQVLNTSIKNIEKHAKDGGHFLKNQLNQIQVSAF